MVPIRDYLKHFHVEGAFARSFLGSLSSTVADQLPGRFALAAREQHGVKKVLGPARIEGETDSYLRSGIHREVFFTGEYRAQHLRRHVQIARERAERVIRIFRQARLESGF